MDKGVISHNANEWEGPVIEDESMHMDDNNWQLDQDIYDDQPVEADEPLALLSTRVSDN